MAHYVFMVLTNPVAGKEDEYNHWYDNVHLPAVVGVEGCVGARRFRYRDVVEPSSPWEYLAIYEWEAESVEEARAALDRAREAGEIDVDDSLDRSQTGAWFFEQTAELSAAL